MIFSSAFNDMILQHDMTKSAFFYFHTMYFCTGSFFATVEFVLFVLIMISALGLKHRLYSDFASNHKYEF